MFKVQGSRFHLLFILLFVFSISACDFSSNKKPRSTGSTNEILVITNTKAMWEGAVGDSIRGFFGQYQVGLPQAEPMFEMYNIPESAINKTFKAMHAIFILDINKDFKEPLLEAKKDLWSQPQLVIKITAPDENSFYEVFDERKDGFLEAYIDLEIRRTNNFFKMAEDHTLGAKLMEKYGIALDVPGGFAVAFENEDFIWLRQTMHKVKQDAELGIIIHKTPYTDTTAFTAENILDLRDTLTFNYLPGPSEGSYMATSRDIIPPVSIRKSDYITDFAVETRGLWMVVNDFMGGPFINYTFTDPENQYLIMLDGYVYNPNGLKRNFVRQLEAIFYTMQFPESK